MKNANTKGGYLEGKTYYIVNYYSSVSDIPKGIPLKNKSFDTKEVANTFLKSIENKGGRGFITDFRKPTQDEISKLDRDRNENYMMAKGGEVTYTDTDNYANRRMGNGGVKIWENYKNINNQKAVGSFSHTYNKRNTGDYYLFLLDDYDRKFYSHIALKPNEMLFRNETETGRISKSLPLIKINIENGRVYFMSDGNDLNSDIDDKNPKFSKVSADVNYLSLDDRIKKYNQGLITYDELFESVDKTYAKGGFTINGRMIMKRFDGTGGKTYNLIKDDRGEKPYYTLEEEESGKIISEGESYYEVNEISNMFGGNYAKGGMISVKDTLDEAVRKLTPNQKKIYNRHLERTKKLGDSFTDKNLADYVNGWYGEDVVDSMDFSGVKSFNLGYKVVALDSSQKEDDFWEFDDDYAKGGKIKVVEKSDDGMVWGRSFPQGGGRAYQSAKDRIESLGKKFDKVMIDGKEISLKEFHNLEDKFDNQSFAKGGSILDYSETERLSFHKADVLDRLENDYDYSKKDAKDFIEKNKQMIVYTSQKGINPFDTIDIINEGMDKGEVDKHFSFAKGGSLDDSIYGSFNVINNYNGDKGTYRLEGFKTADGENYFQLIYRDKSDREDTILSQFYNENEAIKYFNKYKKRLEGHYKISDTIYVNNADYAKGGKVDKKARWSKLHTLIWMGEGEFKIPKTYTEEEVEKQVERFNNNNNEDDISESWIDSEDKKYWILDKFRYEGEDDYAKGGKLSKQVVPLIEMFRERAELIREGKDDEADKIKWDIEIAYHKLRHDKQREFRKEVREEMKKDNYAKGGSVVKQVRLDDGKLYNEIAYTKKDLKGKPTNETYVQYELVEKQFAKGGMIDKDIAKFKKQLIAKEKSRGLYENFGRNEVRKLNDKYDAYEMGDDGVKNYTKIQQFSDWASGYDGTRYATGGKVEKKGNEMIMGGLAGVLLGFLLNK
tara:strand:+ start:4146 stop:6992 length:2847 start_codon:yes stop_codon:yes gene_type:complete